MANAQRRRRRMPARCGLPSVARHYVLPAAHARHLRRDAIARKIRISTRPYESSAPTLRSSLFMSYRRHYAVDT